MLRVVAVNLTVCVLVAAGCGSADEASEQPTVDYSIGTHVVLLGTGTPNADPDRSGPAVAVIVNGTPYLVDAGPGVVRRAAAAERNGVAGLAASNLRHVFLTHLHSDHTVGLSDVIFTPWVLERDQPLELFGPRGTRNMAEHLLAAYEEDIRIRSDGLEPANPDGYKVNAHEIEAGVAYADEHVRVTAFEVRHGSWQQAFGYRFETAQRVIVISGDAAPSESIVEQCDGCDLLIHEVYSQAGFERREPVWQRYHSSFHTSSRELAELAARAQPQLLVLYHQLFWGVSEAALVAEVAAGYPGAVASAKDLDIF